MKLLSIILLLSLQRAKTATGPFCYHDPTCDPHSWPVQYPSCNGTHQSPIDVLTDQAQCGDHLGTFNFTGYSNPQFLLSIKHTKQTVRVTTNTQMKVGGGGLPMDYLTSQFHLHWGNQTTGRGSEHRLNGHQANMEVETNITENAAWKNFTSLIQHLREDGDVLSLNGTFSMMDLISGVNLTKYYRYNGSLTTPECDEVVLWTIFEEPIRLNASLVETFFTDLYVNSSQGIHLLNTFREPQRNTNQVYASQGACRAAPNPTPTPTPTAGSPLRNWAHPLCLLLPLAWLWVGVLEPILY
ncbi:carbonic anhydrase 4-like isoform X2 [Narcine bancroftii]|uniref:carbonic anhydrase 4-like isoform X2 n=1 Tax=Narcine bancroftii TaxID=1343680 RepID=UPI0038314ED8